jgi:hypothetical protein
VGERGRQYECFDRMLELGLSFDEIEAVVVALEREREAAA